MVPPQVLTGSAVAVIAAGKVSVKVIGESAVALKSVTVMVNVELPLGAISAGANAFATCAPVCTLTLAEIAGLVAPSVVVRAPAAIVLVEFPFVSALGFLASTAPEMAHEPLAGMVPPESAIVAGLLALELGVAVPAPHVVVAFGVAAIVIVAGSVSRIAALVSATGFGLVSVMVSVDEVPP